MSSRKWRGVIEAKDGVATVVIGRRIGTAQRAVVEYVTAHPGCGIGELARHYSYAAAYSARDAGLIVLVPVRRRLFGLPSSACYLPGQQPNAQAKA